ncbi:MAG: ATP-grasp domain-containing protein [Gammaproteobacteria bacterium]
MNLLIVAASGRMLAQSAKHAGLAPIVIDLFGDQDTHDLAFALQTVEALAETPLAHAVDALAARVEISAAVYGSGLEAHTSSLEYLFTRLKVYGNTPDTWRRLHDKRAFFAALAILAIPYPETCFIPPRTADNWLVKSYRSAGGAQINVYKTLLGRTARAAQCNDFHDAPYEDCYWQRYQPGVAMSALFLADDRKARIVGINRQWSIAFPNRPFVFSGIMSHAELPETQKHRLHEWLNALSREFALRGLNSLDFIWDGRQIRVLEINPRPSASIALYDELCDGGLLAAHIAACGGVLPNLELRNGPYSAYQIVYALHDCRIPATVDWPSWVSDKPQANSFIRAGAPICSIMARGAAAQQLGDMLRARQQRILNLTMHI